MFEHFICCDIEIKLKILIYTTTSILFIWHKIYFVQNVYYDL